MEEAHVCPLGADEDDGVTYARTHAGGFFRGGGGFLVFLSFLVNVVVTCMYAWRRGRRRWREREREMMMMFSTFLSQVVGPMWLKNKRVRLLSCNQVHVYTPVQLHLMHPESLLESIFDGKLMPSPRLPSLYDAVVGKAA